MIRKLMVPVFAAMAMVMVMGTAAFAADAPVTQPTAAGQCVNFVDADGDGVAETRTVFLKDLHSPIGMALVGNDFYVANTDALVRFKYVDGQTLIDLDFRKRFDLNVIGLVEREGRDGRPRIRLGTASTTRLETGDVLVVLGRDEPLQGLETAVAELYAQELLGAD